MQRNKERDGNDLLRVCRQVTPAPTAVPGIGHVDGSPGQGFRGLLRKLTIPKRLHLAEAPGVIMCGASRRTELMLKLLAAAACALLFAAPLAHAAPNSPVPSFEATALNGEKITDAKLIGQPTILIVTPSKGAAGDTRKWANALRKNLDPTAIRIRDVLAVNLPFFMSEADAIGRAKEKIPARYYDQTWILDGASLEKALDIPTESANAVVIVLDPAGQIIARVSGAPTEQRVRQVRSAVRSMK